MYKGKSKNENKIRNQNKFYFYLDSTPPHVRIKSSAVGVKIFFKTIYKPSQGSLRAENFRWIIPMTSWRTLSMIRSKISHGKKISFKKKVLRYFKNLRSKKRQVMSNNVKQSLLKQWRSPEAVNFYLKHVGCESFSCADLNYCGVQRNLLDIAINMRLS